MNLVQKCTAEFIGTFGLVMAGCGAVAVNQISGGAVTHVGIALTFGMIVAAMIYATGHLSGAHLNPAVTLAFAAGRHFPKRHVIPYVLAQTAGAVAASCIHASTLTGALKQKFPSAVLNLGVTQPVDGVWMTAFIWEALLTFFLMFVIMAVATDHRAIGKAAPIAIGVTVGLEAMFAGALCGAAGRGHGDGGAAPGVARPLPRRPGAYPLERRASGGRGGWLTEVSLCPTLSRNPMPLEEPMKPTLTIALLFAATLIACDRAGRDRRFPVRPLPAFVSRGMEFARGCRASAARHSQGRWCVREG